MVNGIINVYKEKGFTSFDVVAKMRGIFHQKKIGHTGTLDPDAEGVLPVCLGKATKVCDLLTDKDKEYEAVLLLGKKTDTQDISGQVIETAEVNVEEEMVRMVIDSFIGNQKQIPPMYSALKVNGQKLCDLARKGITVERKAREITIYNITVTEISLPEVHMRVQCSKGTYIRTLCNDIGDSLKCCGCMKELKRTKVSSFTEDRAYRLCEIESFVKEKANNIDLKNWNYELFQEIMEPIDAVFEHLPKGIASIEAEKFIKNGNRLPKTMIQFENDADVYERIRIYDWKHSFIGIYSFQQEMNDYKPVKLFAE